MKLYYREFGAEQGGIPVLLLHGLLGSLVNWQRIARHLSEQYHVIVPDLRNHGRSPHADDVSYPALAGDVFELLDAQGIETAVVVGHSMGGKTAMLMALQQPKRIHKLGVVDIAPVTYFGTLGELMDALLELPLDQINNRREADAWLSSRITDKAVRDHMLQNLQRTDQGWRWRNNLKALRKGLDTISSFPWLNQPGPYTGDSLFLKGEYSNYIQPQHLSVLKQYFPNARLVEISGAGHWVYAEQPTRFLQALSDFLADS